MLRLRPCRAAAKHVVTVRCVMTHTPPNSHAAFSSAKSRRVAVIGAGAAGLVAARELRKEGHTVTVFEQTDTVGGVWRYDPNTEDDQLGVNPGRSRVHSSMYLNLRTNLPREIMSYSDFPFDASFLGPRYSTDGRRFCTHAEVLGYLEAFADFFQLRPLVLTRTRVTGVEPLPPAEAAHGAVGEAEAATTAGQGQAEEEQRAQLERQQHSLWADCSWRVTWQRLASHGRASTSNGQAGGEEQHELYDAVVVCNGHYSEPRLPEVRGMDAFRGVQLHSHNYRTPDACRGKVVLVVGASNSGEDISREASAGGAARVLLSARSWKNEAWGADAAPYGPGGNIYRFPMVTELHADGCATFADGRREGPVDVVVYCTGYSYAFPFLRGAARELVRNEDNHVHPLWQHLMPPALAPGLSFIGLPWKVVPFPQFELQARLVARLLSGRAALPSPEEMAADIELHQQAMREQGVPTRYAHMQNLEQFAYNQQLLRLADRPGPAAQQPSPSGSTATNHDTTHTHPTPANGASGTTYDTDALLSGDVSHAIAAPWREELYRATGAMKRARPEDYRDADIAQWGGPGVAKALEEAQEEMAVLVERITGRRGGSLSGNGNGEDGVGRGSAGVVQAVAG